MGDLFKKVAAGDDLDVAAQFYNLVVDAVRDYLRRTQSGGAGDASVPRDGTIVQIRNNTGGDLDIYSVVAMGAAEIDPTSDNLQAFQAGPILSGDTPAVPADLGRFAVLLEPVADGSIGTAAAGGVVVVQLNVIDAADTFADVSDGVTDSLDTGTSGCAQILYKESGTGTVWGVVRFGGGGAGGTDYLQNVTTDVGVFDTLNMHSTLANALTFAAVAASGTNKARADLKVKPTPSNRMVLQYNGTNAVWDYVRFHT